MHQLQNRRIVRGNDDGHVWHFNFTSLSRYHRGVSLGSKFSSAFCELWVSSGRENVRAHDLLRTRSIRLGSSLALSECVTIPPVMLDPYPDALQHMQGECVHSMSTSVITPN